MTKNLHLYISLCVFALSFGMLSARAESFRSSILLHTAAQPIAIAADDLNGDGKKDLVYSPFGGSIIVRLNDGSGGFGTEVTYTAPIGIRSLLITDINKDGKPDIVAGGGVTFNAEVAVLFGNGDGTFQPPIVSMIGTSNTTFPVVANLAVGDFNGDGNVDLVVSDRINNVIYSVSGDGAGHFQTAAAIPQFTAPADLFVADLNNDQKLDFVVFNLLSADADVYLGNGNGTFQSPTRISNPNHLRGLFFADVNGDHLPDLLSRGDDGNLIVLLGQGNGSFQLASGAGIPAAFTFASILGVHDFDGDGKLDIAVTSIDGLQILFGNGDLTFRPGPVYALVSFPSALLFTDLNGDGIPDVAASGFDNTNSDPTIGILFASQNGTFDGAFAYDVGAPVNSAAWGDVNGDNIPDIVVGTSRTTASVLLGDGNGDFQVPSAPGSTFASTPGSISIADFNGDGKADLLLAHGSAALQLGLGDGTFGAPISLFNSAPYSCALAFDVNKDNKADIVVAGSVFLGNGDGTFTTPAGAPTFASCFDFPPVIADLNHDGKLDMAFIDGATAALDVQLGNGDGTFQSAVSYPLINFGNDVAIGDFDEDGNPDLVVSVSFKNLSALFLGKADGTFSSPVQINTPHAEVNVAVGDLNGDGHLDLVFSDGKTITVMHGNGDGTFGPPADYIGGTSPGKPIVADANQDGAPDLILPNIDTNGTTSVTVLLNRGGTKPFLSSSATPSQFGQPVTITANIVPSVSGSPVPAGTANLRIDGVALKTPDVSGGKTSITTSQLTIGSHVITGNYSGDESFNPHVLRSLTQVVVQANTSTAVSSSSNPAIVGQPLTIAARVSPAFTGIPTGSITLSDGGSVVGSGMLDGNGSFSIVMPNLAAGEHSLTASYSGDANFKASTSATFSQRLLFASATTISSSADSQIVGTNLTFNIHVTSPNGNPSGTVKVLDGDSEIGDVQLDGSGAAMLSTAALAGGLHAISAQYQGDNTFASSTASLTQHVEDFSAGAASSASATIHAGQSANFTMNLTAAGGFSGSVTFACSGLPLLANCSFNPNSASVSGSAAVPVMVTVQTAGPTADLKQGPLHHSTLFLAFAISGCGTLGMLFAGGKRQPAASLVCMMLLCLMVVGLPSCGGGGNSSNSSPPPITQPSTPSGTSTVVVTSTATQNGVTISHQTRFTLIVQ